MGLTSSVAPATAARGSRVPPSNGTYVFGDAPSCTRVHRWLAAAEARACERVPIGARAQRWANWRGRHWIVPAFVPLAAAACLFGWLSRPCIKLWRPGVVCLCPKSGKRVAGAANVGARVCSLRLA
ncbi:unnamed protein product [Ixodes pacificus]